MHAQKISPEFMSDGETLLNIMKDLGTNMFFDICKYYNTNLFKRVVEGMTEEGCVCIVELVRHHKEANGTSGSSRPTIPYFHMINVMLGHIF